MFALSALAKCDFSSRISAGFGFFHTQISFFFAYYCKLIYEVSINFTDREIKFLKVLASGRHYLKDIVKPNRQSVARWGNTQEQADMLGVMGEYAVAKYLGLPFDTSINLDGDGGETDLMLGSYNIQVKSTKYKTGRLVFNNLKEIIADLFVLCYCSEPEMSVEILGYIKKEAIKNVSELKDLGYGLRIVIEQRHLLPIADLNQLDKSL
jgi:hypothetical protein